MLQRLPQPHEPQRPEDDAKRLASARLQLRRRETLFMASCLLLAAILLLVFESLFHR